MLRIWAWKTEKTIPSCRRSFSFSLARPGSFPLLWPISLFSLVSPCCHTKMAYFKHYVSILSYSYWQLWLRKKLYSSVCRNELILSLIRKFCSSSIHSIILCIFRNCQWRIAHNFSATGLYKKKLSSLLPFDIIYEYYNWKETHFCPEKYVGQISTRTRCIARYPPYELLPVDLLR